MSAGENKKDIAQNTKLFNPIFIYPQQSSSASIMLLFSIRWTISVDRVSILVNRWLVGWLAVCLFVSQMDDDGVGCGVVESLHISLLSR